MWIGKSPLGLLHYRIANPIDDFVLNFDCGSDAFATEVNNFFRKSKFSKQNTVIIEFGFPDNEHVGLAALRLVGHTLIVLALGICPHWQGKSHPMAPEIRATTMAFLIVEEVAKEQLANQIELWVRADNMKAIRAYRKMGLEISRTFIDGDKGLTHEMVKKLI